jgi:CoA:oxalate CoA-transferase
MLDGQIAILENAVARTVTSGVAPGPLGARHPSITPFAAYQCADAPIVIAAGNDGLWAALLDALGLSGLKANPKFASNAARTEAADEIATILEAALATAPAAHWLEVLDKAGVPCGPLQDVKQSLAHPQVQARNMLIDTALPDGTPLKAAGNPIKLSAHPDPTTRPRAPKLDEHRAQILKDLNL